MSDNQYEIMLSKLITQYQNSPKFLQLLKLYADQFQQLIDCLNDMLNKRDIDNGEGKQLDIIGDIVGQIRITYKDIYYFYLRKQTEEDRHHGYTNQRGSKYGAPFWTLKGCYLEGLLPDSLYKVLLRARIGKNTARANEPESLINIVKLVTEAKNICFETGDAWVSYSIGTLNTKQLEILLAILDIIPRPTSYKMIFIAKHDPDSYFHLQASTEYKSSTKGFGLGSLKNPNIGGKLGTIILANT